MAAPVIQSNFNAGELSKNLWARVDLEKYHSGAALLRNFFVDYRGGASTRAGTKFIAACKTGTTTPRLIPFQFSTTQTYVLEFGNLYVRIYSNGAAITGPDFELVTPYAEADLPLLKYAQSADTMTLVHPSYAPQLLKRTGPNTFTLTAMAIGPVIAPPTNLVGAITTSHTLYPQYSYCVTSVDTNSGEESLPCAPVFFNGGDTNGNLNATCAVRLKWTASISGPDHYNIYKNGPNGQINGTGNLHNQCTVYGYIGQAVGTQFVDSGLVPDFTKTPPMFNDPFSPGQVLDPITVTAAGSGFTDTSQPSCTPSSGAATFLAFLNDSGGVGTVIAQYRGSYGSVPTLTISGGGGTGATATIGSIGPLTGTWPSCVSFFQQRQYFAASNNSPQTIWGSQAGNVFNFDQALVPLASDSIQIQLASRQVNQIKSMVPMPTGMVLLTSGGAWLLSGGGQQLAVTPIDIAAQPQASTGANDMPPIVVNNSILYVQSRGSIIRDLIYNFYVQSYFGTDRSSLANHLFYGYQMVDWCWAEEPFRTVWITRNDGIMLCMTYVPEQEVFAWSHHDTQGQFISTASVVEGQEDAIYFIVKRFVGGTWVNYIERMASRNFYGNVEFAWCLDCALSLAQSTPNAALTLSAASGNITITASASVFTSGSVGQILRGLYGGKATITGYTDGTHVSAKVVPDGTGSDTFPLIPDDPNGTPALIPSGNWMIATPVTSITGLTQLEGKEVVALADGQVIEGLTVSNTGTLTLPQAASYIIVGLGFTAQLQTLYLDTGEPTIQSKRKFLPVLTSRVQDTRGLKIGTSFDTLIEYKDPGIAANYTPPLPLYTGDLTDGLYWNWDTHGDVCCQQDYPLPATILGLIPQVVLGDTGR